MINLKKKAMTRHENYKGFSIHAGPGSFRIDKDGEQVHFKKVLDEDEKQHLTKFATEICMRERIIEAKEWIDNMLTKEAKP